MRLNKNLYTKLWNWGLLPPSSSQNAVICPYKRLENSLEKLQKLAFLSPIIEIAVYLANHCTIKPTSIQACRACNHLLCNSLFNMGGPSRITTFKDHLQRESQKIKHIKRSKNKTEQNKFWRNSQCRVQN